MGMSFNVYLGPFIRVPLFHQAVTFIRYECSGCGNRRVDKLTTFCPACGKEVLSISEDKQELAIPRPYVLRDDLSEQAFVAESSYSKARMQGFIDWIPNIRDFGVTFSEDRNEQGLVLDDAARGEAMAKFMAFFQPMVDEIETHFGVKAQVLYGVVPYSH